MDATLQRHCARYIYVVPDGLQELLSDISREVLRSQPSPQDIYTFIADYLDSLLITRENARVSAKFVEYMTQAAETIVDLLEKTGMQREEANAAATVIQEAFKSWEQKKGILKDDEDDIVARILEDIGISESQLQMAAVVIQNAFRTFKLRKQRQSQLKCGIVDWRVAARSAIRLYRKTGVSPEEAKRAANLIKAAYKGYYTRRAIRVLNEQMSVDEDRDEVSDSYYDEDSSSFRLGDDRKSKGVRIDYNTVVPHVDFAGEELISHDITITDEEPEPPPHDDVMMRIFGEFTEIEETSTEVVKDIIHDILSSVVVEERDDVVPIEDNKSDTDTFVQAPHEELEQPLYSRSQILPTVSQEFLEKELDETKTEMLEVKLASESRQNIERTASKISKPSSSESRQHIQKSVSKILKTGSSVVVRTPSAPMTSEDVEREGA